MSSNSVRIMCSASFSAGTLRSLALCLCLCPNLDPPICYHFISYRGPAFNSLYPTPGFVCVDMTEYPESREASAGDVSAAGAIATTRSPWHSKLNPLRWGGMPPVPEEPIPSPEYEAGLLSKLTFHWINPLMITGYKRTKARSIID